MRTLAVIPARAGSKSVPGKNKRMFCGKPLAAWAIECGLRTCVKVCVTSDDDDVLELADSYGVDAIERPWDLAQDDTPMLDVLRHVLAWYPRPVADVIVLLQPTSPLRTDQRVNQALCVLQTKPFVSSVVSVAEIPQHYNPAFALRIERGLLRFPVGMPTRRQDCGPAYYRDGTVYAFRDALLRGGEMWGNAAPLVIPAGESVNIDTEGDWKLAEEMWSERHAQR